MAEEKLCAVDGCCKSIVKRGYCSSHYRRLLRHGDPLKGNAQHGTARRWLESKRNHDGEGCLIWPFSRTKGGYALVRVQPGNQSMQVASRVMCEMVNGPPPESRYEAAHSCGNGSGGCVHPKHLRWVTPSENREDKRLHGTLMVGATHYAAKHLESRVIDHIRAMKGVLRQRVLAEEYGVSTTTINRIQTGKHWASNRENT